MSKELEKYIDERLAEYEKHWEENPMSPMPPVVDTGRKLFRIDVDTPASAFDFTAEEGHTTYEVVGHFNPDAPENLFQKIMRRMREEKSSQ